MDPKHRIDALAPGLSPGPAKSTVSLRPFAEPSLDAVLPRITGSI
jgi:hypothetical protein